MTGEVDPVTFGMEIDDIDHDDVSADRNEESIAVPPVNVSLSDNKIHHITTNIDPLHDDNNYRTRSYQQIIDLFHFWGLI